MPMPPRPAAVATAMMGSLSLDGKALSECCRRQDRQSERLNARPDLFGIRWMGFVYSGPFEPMSLPRPPNRKPFRTDADRRLHRHDSVHSLAAYTAAALGDDYNTRALIYCGFLLWCIVGAVVLFMKTWQSENQKISPARCLLWCASLWLWPLLLLPGLFQEAQLNLRSNKGCLLRAPLFVCLQRSTSALALQTLGALGCDGLVDPPLLENRQNVVRKPVEQRDRRRTRRTSPRRRSA